MMVLEGHGLDVAPKSKVANMLFLAAKITSQLGLNKPDRENFCFPAWVCPTCGRYPVDDYF